MKRWIPVALFLLLLSGCSEKPREEAQKGINKGFVNFAAILVLDDLIAHGADSEFAAFSPVPMVTPEKTMTAEAVLEDFRKDLADAREKYPLKLSEGLVITWKADHDAPTPYGISYHQEGKVKNRAFAGKVSVRFDPEYYSATPYPLYAHGANVSVVCREFSGVMERKTPHLFWVEVSFDKCLTTADYNASLKNQLKAQQEPLRERLMNVYTGSEPVPEALGQKLLAYYLAGDAFAPDSVCLTGGREACLANLKQEIVRRYTDVKAGENIKIRQEGKAPATTPTPEKADKAAAPPLPPADKAPAPTASPAEVAPAPAPASVPPPPAQEKPAS